MPFVTRKFLLTLTLLLVAALLLVIGFVWSGIYNMGADDTHTRPVYALLETLRDRSVTVRARRLHPPPNLSDAALIRQGAGNYDSMCTGCHLAPGKADTELSKGLYPAPPAFAKVAVGDPAHHFWVIKHGIKASGMPAWGKSMQDKYIWGMVAFLQQIPQLDAAQYQAMVASSGGHSHGGGETKPHGLGKDAGEDHGDMTMEGMPVDESAPHDHAPGSAPHDDAPADVHSGMQMDSNATGDDRMPDAHPPGTPADHHKLPSPAPSTQAPKTIEHRHADGTVESHPAPETTPADASNHH